MDEDQKEWNLSHTFDALTPELGAVSALLAFKSVQSARRFKQVIRATEPKAEFSKADDIGDEPMMAVRFTTSRSGEFPETVYDHWAGSVEDGAYIVEMGNGLRLEITVGKKPKDIDPEYIDGFMPGVLFILQKDGILIGKACLTFHNEDMGTTGPTLRTIEIKKPFQRNGYGKKLLAQIEDFLMDNGFSEIQVWNAGPDGAAFMETNDYECLDDVLREEWRKVLI